MSSSNLPVRPRSKARKENSNFSLYLIGGVLLALIIGVIAINIWNSQPNITVAALDVSESWINRNSLGNPDAKVVIDAYEDFLCPACRQWTAQVKPQLYEEYVKTGKVRFVFNPFPLDSHGFQAMIAANASLCAADQGLFWQLHDTMFNIAESKGQAGLDLNPLADSAETIGIDRSEFLKCMNAQKHQKAVTESITRGAQTGVDATPTIFINGTKLTEPFDYDAMKLAIEAALAG